MLPTSKIESPSHYKDQVLREAARLYKSKMGRVLNINLNTLDMFADGQENIYLEFKVEVDGSYLSTAHCINENWTLERNAWEIGQKIATKLKHRKVLY